MYSQAQTPLAQAEMSTGGPQGETEPTGPAQHGEVQERRLSLSALADTEDPRPSWESCPTEETGPGGHQAAPFPCAHMLVILPPEIVSRPHFLLQAIP